jgi:hypothetical protein
MDILHFKFDKTSGDRTAYFHIHQDGTSIQLTAAADLQHRGGACDVILGKLSLPQPETKPQSAAIGGALPMMMQRCRSSETEGAAVSSGFCQLWHDVEGGGE